MNRPAHRSAECLVSHCRPTWFSSSRVSSITPVYRVGEQPKRNSPFDTADSGRLPNGRRLELREELLDGLARADDDELFGGCQRSLRIDLCGQVLAVAVADGDHPTTGPFVDVRLRRRRAGERLADARTSRIRLAGAGISSARSSRATVRALTDTTGPNR